MTPERLRQIEELYHAAREATAAERAALLAQAAPDVRQELESLLAERSGGEFLERPAVQNAPGLLADEPATSVAPGACLGPYRIESKLGEGGMGEVFQAVDTRLGRAIAIKVAREQFGARFEREARAISALNHPNICTLHDVGPNFLVMELVEGETLAARLKNGPLPLETVLQYASQIASALAEAHGKGIVHRDLKPGNIMLGKSGVKVLDFGLARMGPDESVTASHMIMGTPAYMAPEQREGKTADARSDIYAFGCVLYEMLTGARVGPQRKRLQPRKMERIVDRCLKDDPAQRWQSATEVQQALAATSPVRRGPSIGAGLAAMLALGGAVYLYLHRQPKLTTKDTIVLAEFENKTGDPIFDQTLRQALAVELEQSPYLRFVSDQSIRQSLRLMNLPLETHLTPDVSREICERTGSAAVLEGSISSLGNQYILWLRARSCRTGDALAQEQVQAARKEDVLGALSRIATRIRTRLGESLATIQVHSTPLEQATTPSLEALKAYSAAMIARNSHGGPAAIPHLRQAIAIDPQFAMAHAELGFIAWNIGQTDLAAGEIRIAYGLRERVSDLERRYIEMLYDRQVTGNLQKELQTLESWAQTYPLDVRARGIMSGWVARGTGQYEKGIQAAREAIPLGPDVPFTYESLAIHQMSLNRFKEAEDALRLAAERKLEVPEMLVSRYYLAFLQDDPAGMEREIARAPEEHSADRMAHHQALVLARSGRMQQARNKWAEAIALARQAARPESVAIYTAAAAVCEAHAGNFSEARSRAHSALDLAKGRDVEYAAAFALAFIGDAKASKTLADELAKRFPEDTPVQFEYLPVLAALFALDRKAPLEAIERLQTALPFDYAMPGTAFFAKFGGLYPAYVRGVAFLAAGRHQQAAVEFQKILNHRGIVLADPVGVLAHLQLGRAYAAAGDKAKAKSAYQDFLALWKDADPDLPVLRQARVELAKL